MARPQKHDDEHRQHHLRVRLTTQELASIKERVNLSGVCLSDYVRQAALTGGVTLSRRAKADPVLIAELNRIGVNLNQLTRTANSKGQVPPDLNRLCRKIEAVVMQAIEQEDADGPDHHG